MVDTARLLLIPSRTFLAALREQPEIAFNMMASMSRHLRGLVQQIEQLSTRTALERLARFLVSLADGADKPARVRLPLDKALIAARLGMQPETFSRSLARLRQFGVEEEEGELVIPDPRVLQRIAEGEAGEPRRP